MPADNAKRLSIPLNDDGQIDLDHMRPSSAQKLVDLIRTDPTIRDTYKELNGPPADQVSLAEGLTQENVAAGLDIIQKTNALVFRIAAARFIKHPVLKDQQGKHIPLIVEPEVLDAAFSLTPKQHAELDPRAHRLALKYSSDMPEWLKKNLDLYMFAGMFLSYTAENAKNALAAQIKRDIARYNEAWRQRAVATPKNPQPDSDAVQAQPINGHDRNPAQPPFQQTTEEILDPLRDILRQQPPPENNPTV